MWLKGAKDWANSFLASRRISLPMPEISLLPFSLVWLQAHLHLCFTVLQATTFLKFLVSALHPASNASTSSAAMTSCTSQIPVELLRRETEHPICLCGHRVNKNLHGFALLGQLPHHLQAHRRVVQSSQRVMLTLCHAVTGHRQDLPVFVCHLLLPRLPKKHDWCDEFLLCHV